MRVLRKKRLYVFQLPQQWQVLPMISLEEGLDIVKATSETINYFFNQDKTRCNLFKRFLAKGFYGVIQYHGTNWISYAWMKIPGTVGPPHLPLFIQKLNAYWIFYCRTADEFQGQGCFKRSLITLCKWVRDEDENGKIFIDTETSNIASRKAILAVGFMPRGIIETKGIYIPKLKPLIWGKWLTTDKSLRGDYTA